ncbi:uncharacterized protein [Salvelinus sp. IW2-2015]|uniref:uncharacterized protein n=1 Tax=Salvelinus sp. IW2-2015 TaxID=2691554 RepID=UPI000CDF5838|nr:uncharacterized protein LOC111982309 [Salvelinus alpinus]
MSHVRSVLERLIGHPLYSKAEKCLFFQQAVSFLGYRISTARVEMEEQRVNAVRSWPVPSNIKAVQRFLGFANYFRRFIRGFSRVVAPLTFLLKGGPRQLRWTGEANEAFCALKERFTNASVLAHPDPSLSIVEVDASEVGGA